MKRLSVIIPCYNAVSYLPRLMDSLLRQTLDIGEMEIICVNDASTDETYQELLGYEKRCPESLMVINLPQNGRQGAARNIGLSYASGVYVGFVDADDYIEPDMFEKLLKQAEKYDLDMAGGLVCHHENGKETVMPNHLRTDGPVRVESPQDRMELILHGNCGGIVSKIYKKALLEMHQLYFPEGTYYEDNYWLPLVCLYVDSYLIMDEVVYHYIDHPSSTTNQRNEQAMSDRLNMEVQKLHAYVQRGFFKQYYPGIEALFCRSYYVDTLLSIFTLFGEVPMHFYEEMKTELTALFPRCMENTMLQENDKELLCSAFENLTQKQLHQRILDYAGRAGKR